MAERRPDRFEELAAEALDGLPEWVRERMENVEVLIEDRPHPGQPGLLGLYEGVPLANRGSHYGSLPDRITLFRRAIERAAGRDDDRLRALVAHVVAHEVAHHFGITDERLKEIDAY